MSAFGYKRTFAFQSVRSSTIAANSWRRASAMAQNTTADTTAEFYTPDFGVKGNVRQLTGPKRVLAVGKFNSMGAFRAFFGDWDEGGGVEAILMHALVQSGQFDVVDRSALDQVLTQQEMTEAGITSKNSGPKTGRIIGANLLIIGSITQVDLDTKGTGVSIGISLGRKGSAGIAPSFRSGTLVIDVRLVDTETSRIVNTFVARQQVKDKSVAVSVDYDIASFGTTSFWKTPIGDAMRRLIADVVTQVVDAGDSIAWSAKVIDYAKGRIFINSGAVNGLAVGDEFIVRRVEKIFTDPDTGDVLGTRYAELGRVGIIIVEERFSEGIFTPLTTLSPARGDLVQLPD
jgi:curli biogenesis system outer membrane secretion channel CsgG